MSAFIAVKRLDRVQLLTDGACYNAEHVLTKIVCKVWSSNTLPLAITGRGNLQLVEHIAREIIDQSDAAGSVDHVIESFIPEYIEDLKAVGADGFDMSIAAWSETGGPSLYYLDSDGERPFELRGDSWVRWCASEVSGKELCILAGARLLIDDPLWLKDFGGGLMELIRSKPTQGYYSVGGHCQLTTVTAVGVEAITLREWPEDKVGARIEPFVGSPNVTVLRKPALAMNRQQRRAARQGARSRHVDV